MGIVISKTSLTTDEIIARLPKYVKLSGSRALGTQTANSDWDFYVPESKWDEFKAWAFTNIGRDFTSAITGHIAYRLSLDPYDLIEFSILFPKY